jgi:hypothetical protein
MLIGWLKLNNQQSPSESKTKKEVAIPYCQNHCHQQVWLDQRVHATAPGTTHADKCLLGFRWF